MMYVASVWNVLGMLTLAAVQSSGLSLKSPIRQSVAMIPFDTSPISHSHLPEYAHDILCCLYPDCRSNAAAVCDK
jgi:hypothetical protein